MNNQNDAVAEDFDEFLGLGIPSDSIPAEIMEACERTKFDELGMPIISAEEPYSENPAPAELSSDLLAPTDLMPHLNNQAEMMEIEVNMDKLQFNNGQREQTLTQLSDDIRSEFNDDTFGLQYEEEKKTYADLSQSTTANYGQYGEPMEYEIDQKSDYFQFQQAQQPIQVNRMEMAQDAQLLMSNPTYPYPVDQKMIYKADPSFLPSVQSSPSQSIDDYFPRDNNTNCSPSPQYSPEMASVRSSRSRKSSITSNPGKMMGAKRIIGKVALEEKPFRRRMTKAEKNKLTADELKNRHLEQNKNNAKKCVQNKKNLKQQLTEMKKHLTSDLSMIEKRNRIQENGLLKAYEIDVYPHYLNNAPYGHPAQFLEQMESLKVDNNGLTVEVEDLKKDFDVKEAKHRFYQGPNKNPSLSQNTYASQKSRAKTEWELAELLYSTANLKLQCEKAMEFGGVLEQITETINDRLAGMGHTKLAEHIHYEGFQQFEPS